MTTENPGPTLTCPENFASTSSFQYTRIYPTPAIDSAPIATSTDRPDAADAFPARDPPSRGSPEPTQGQTDSQGHYVGSSSAASFLLRIQKRLHQNSSLSHDSSIFTFGDAPLPEFDPSFFVLPPKPDAQRLVERYFDFAAPTHRFLHRPSIERLVEEFYETQGEMQGREDGKAKAALLMVVFAQAQAYMPPGSTVQENRSVVTVLPVFSCSQRSVHATSLQQNISFPRNAVLCGWQVYKRVYCSASTYSHNLALIIVGVSLEHCLILLLRLACTEVVGMTHQVEVKSTMLRLRVAGASFGAHTPSTNTSLPHSVGHGPLKTRISTR